MTPATLTLIQETKMTKYAVQIEYVNGRDGEKVYPTLKDAEIERDRALADKSVVSAEINEVADEA